MKIFICGWTGSGKTHLAKLLSQALGLKNISASGWLREWDEVQAQQAKDESKGEYTQRLTEMSLDVLSHNPDICIDWLKKQNSDIIDGLRNPRDFTYLYNPETDIVIWCVKNDVTEPATPFEDKGLVAIWKYINFQKIIHPKLKMIIVNHSGPPSGLESRLELILREMGAEKSWRLK